MKRGNPPLLRHIASLWSMVDYPTTRKPWTLERRIAAIKEAGFDGFTDIVTPEHARLAAKYDLTIVAYFTAIKESEFRPFIQQALGAGGVHINVQLADHDTPVEKSIKLCVKLMQESEKLGAKCAVEVHRDTCTETPEKTYAIAAGYKKATGRLLPMTWDFSHLSVVKHLSAPFAERLLVDAKLIQHAQQFHFRPFNGHHAQVPVTNGHGKLSRELKNWIPFLEETLALWLKGHQDGRELFAVPELGSVRSNYNFEQLPNSWEEAKVLRPLIEKTWRRVLGRQGAHGTNSRFQSITGDAHGAIAK